MRRLINIGREKCQLQLTTIVFERYEPVSVIQIGAHYRGHKLGRIVCLQVSRLIGQHCIRGRMRFIEPVTSEFLHQIEDTRRRFLRNATIGRASHKYLALLLHVLKFLLTHSTPQQVCAAERVAREYLRNLHNLFLIQNDAIRFFEYWLELRMKIINIRLVSRMLTRNKIVDHARLQRPGSEQCNQCDQVVELIRSHALYQITHAVGLQLEHRRGARATQQLECFAVMLRQAIYRKVQAGMRVVNDPYSPVDNC